MSSDTLIGRVGPLLIALGVGIAAIFLSRFLIPGTAGASIAALLAIVVIAVLGVYYHRVREDIDINRGGDDLYYLGFLFTLSSLVYALITLFILESKTDYSQRTDELIGNFGIALLSTIAGILGRIMLQSMGHPSEHGTEAHLQPAKDLHMLARRLRTEMRGASDAFSHYNRMTMLQAEATKEHAARMVKHFTEKLEENTQSAVVKTANIYQGMAGQIQETSETLERHSDKVARVLDTHAEKLNSANASMDRLCADVEQTRGGMADFGQTLGEQGSRSANFLQELNERINTVKQSLAEFPDTMKRIQGQFDALGETAKTAMTGLDDKAEQITSAYGNLTDIAGKQQEIMEKDLERAREVSSHMETALPQWVGHTERMQKAFEAINQSLTDLRSGIEQTQAGLKEQAVKATIQTAEKELGGKVNEITEACAVLTENAQKQNEVMEKILEILQAAIQTAESAREDQGSQSFLRKILKR